MKVVSARFQGNLHQGSHRDSDDITLRASCKRIDLLASGYDMVCVGGHAEARQRLQGSGRLRRRRHSDELAPLQDAEDL